VGGAEIRILDQPASGATDSLLFTVKVNSSAPLGTSETALIDGGPSFHWLTRVHRWSSYAITPVLLGHILIASGVLPGYRGVARSMHLGGKLRAEGRRAAMARLARRYRAGRRSDGP
jgi:hypothetical protein